MKTLPPRIETGRLLLRAYVAADAESLSALIRRNQDELIDSFPKMVARVAARDDAAGHIQERSELWAARKYFSYGIWTRSGGAPVGEINFKNIDWEIPSGELGYLIDAGHRRQGFAREAMRALTAACFESLGFRRVFVRVFPDNGSSLALAQSAGFVREGVHRNDFLSGKGQVRDLVYLSMTDEDWRGAQ
ncbi:MAG: GNAT family N-acetyltransferase [Elusimicrobiota bacterium]